MPDNEVGGIGGSRALSVLIPTLGREESLRTTIRGLASSDGFARIELTVIENGGTPTLTPESLTIPGIDSVRVLHEPRRGKAAALNRALQEGGLAPLIAILDDDMSPAPGWCSSVVRSAASRPAFDVFSGRSHVVWPEGVPRPPWAEHPFAQGMAFSVLDLGPAGDHEMGAGAVAYPSGNHFWFRRAVLDSVPRVPELWPPEPDFVLQLRAAGHRGVFVPEVVCGHRVQASLFDAHAFYDRASAFGFALERFQRMGLRRTRRGDSDLLWRSDSHVLRSCAGRS